VRSSHETEFGFMVDDDPHPFPLPSDGRGNGHRQSWVGGGCPASAVAGFSVRRRMVLPLLQGEGRGEVEP